MEHRESSFTYRQLIQFIAQFIRPYRRKFWFGTSMRLSIDLTYLYTTYALSQAIAFFATYRPGDSLASFWRHLGGWAVSYAYVHIGQHVAKYYCYQVAEQAKLDCERQTVRHFSNIDISWHEKENTGNKMKRMQNAGESLDKVLRIWVDTLIEIGVNVVGIILIVSFIDLRIGLVLLLFFLTTLLLYWPLSRRISQAARAVNQEEEAFSGLAFELVNNIRSVKVMNMAEKLLAMLERQSGRVFGAVVNRVWWFRARALAGSMWGHLFRIGAMVAIAYGIIAGRYDVSFLILFNSYFTHIRASADQMSNVSQDIVIARFRLARLSAILQEPITIDDDTGKIDFPAQWRNITFRNVSFSYGDREVLKDVSFHITRGEKIGIVGLSGAGKTTLFKLLLKEYEDFTGEILIDNLPIQKIKKRSYAERVAVVLQETEVFHFSLKENITIANTEKADDPHALAKAFTIAHVADFAARLPDGADTLVGEKGVKLSGGEKQRVGIARAIFKQPDILFLDEATSHLDLESEEKIKDSLHRFFREVTAVVIAHRLTTIQEMDRIFVMEQGRIIESGNFAELYKQRGRFFELWEKQRL